MAPKSKKSKNNNKIINKRTKTESKETANCVKNEETDNSLTEVSNGLRRSSRAPKAIAGSASKSKYFSDSEDNNESDDSIENDEEFKPEVKRKTSLVKPTKRKSGSDLESSSSEEDDWEEVKDNAKDSELEDYNPDIPSEGVDIILKESTTKKMKKKSDDPNNCIRQSINRLRKELQFNKHKTSLLLLISRAFYFNNSVNDELIKAIALSVTVSAIKAPKRLSLKFLNEFIDWFNENFELNDSKSASNESMTECLKRCLDQRVAQNSVELNLTFIALIRSLSEKYITRLCYVLNPVDLKATDLILSQKQSEIQKKSPKNGKKSSNKTETNKKPNKSKKRKTVSTESETEINAELSENLLLLWIEVYLESEGKWICLDLSNNIVDKPLQIAAKSLPQISYIIGLDSDGYIREVTQRYANEWMSAAMKRRRIDQKWWSETLEAFQRKTKSAAEKAEESEFEEKFMSTPLPTKVSEYKNHPLYVLKKDLLRYQGIYPADAPPLGFFKEEPVYARECVHLLHSREAWLRKARTVRVGETAYKAVTSTRKWDRFAQQWKKDLPLDLFGFWQTEPYDPPEAKDGIVPRNGYGNVDLYLPSMLPKGCVYLQLSGLLRIAKKLDIDCVPAIVGFDNNLGARGFHPTIGGFVVCQEFKDILIDAWDEEQEIAKKREIDKKEKRVLDNWKKLMKGLLIREKLQKRYRNGDEDSDETEIESDN